MTPRDRKLGMDRAITRRDFIHDVGLASLALNIPLNVWAAEAAAQSTSYYPPTRTGLRGSHTGSFEAAHALAREHKLFDPPKVLGESYDLIVVGGGLSGLAAAYFYRQKHGPESRILILDNHDDFGGHAKRNEFHQGGQMRLAWGGTVNMEYTKYSEVAKGLLDDLGINIPRLLEDFQFHWNGDPNGMQGSTWFDAGTYGREVLLPGVRLSDIEPEVLAGQLDSFPVSDAARVALRGFLLSSDDVLAGKTMEQKQAYLKTTSYLEFLREHFSVPDDGVQLFSAQTMGFWGVRAENLSVAECLETGLPGWHVLGKFEETSVEDEAAPSTSAMFPDGNSSIARLLVRSMIPAAIPAMTRDSDPFDIVTAKLHYDQIDLPDSPVRVRLNSTAIHAVNTGDGTGVKVNYVKEGQILQVTGRRCVMACYNAIIPYLCPQLPDLQKSALKQSIRRPMLIMNVAIRNGEALRKSGISAASLPGSLCQSITLVTGVNVGEYHPQWSSEDTCVMQFYGAVGAPNPDGLTISEQNEAGRQRLLGMSLEDFEREIRTVMNGIWGASGFNAADDILAIMVDRWPHGYARDHIDLEDPAWNADPPPNVVGRQPFGNITIANSDAGADAYTHTAIDQAWRAVNELPD